ncbi:hypothetical protein [Nitrosomonas ureae]|uniref:Uncharacterized protein n=1 Tax=Nitrosomonas ureae TaxID=44577 RepID=A0A1H5VCZ6_9PROT|nr:hypothetical protein [Nitrosomonas ureae]SEF85103.1 hypothetical protein SAMN05216334_11220 [Nitrosomonas ureae]
MRQTQTSRADNENCVVRRATNIPNRFRLQSSAAVIRIDKITQAMVFENLAVVRLAATGPVAVLVEDFHQPVGILVAILVGRSGHQICGGIHFGR